MRIPPGSIAIVALGVLLTTRAVRADFPADGTAPTEGWKYGFRSVIDTATYPLAQDKEGASGMSQEAAWKDIVNWPPLASSGGTFSSLGRPDAVVAYIEGGVNYWRNGHTQLIKKIYINAPEVLPRCYHSIPNRPTTRPMRSLRFVEKALG